MKRITRKIAFLTASLMAFGLVGCQNEQERQEAAGGAVSFDLAVPETLETKSSVQVFGSQTYLLTGENGTVIPMIATVEDMPSPACPDETKATFYNDVESFQSQTFGVYGWNGGASIYTAESVTYSSSESIWWPCTRKVWPESTTLSFEAYYPVTSAATRTFTALASKEMDFSFTMPTGTAGAPEDLMFACYTGDGTGYTKPATATLKFTHALSGVKFKVGTLPGISKINSIKIEHAYASGTCDVTTTSGQHGYSWTGSGDKTLSASVQKTVLTDGTDLGADYTFLVIPQNLATRSVTITVNFTDEAGVTFNAAETLTTGEWQAGRTTTYILKTNDSDITVTDVVEDNVKKNVVITNSGTAKAYIRASIVGGWYNDENEFVASWSPATQGTWTGKYGSNWTEASDGFVYYTNPVDPGQPTSTALFGTYTYSESDVPVEGAHLVMNIAVQTVIYDMDKARVRAAWGAAAAALLKN